MTVGIKEGSNVSGLRSEILLAYFIACSIYEKYPKSECVITEGTGGKHGVGSLHYVGLAIDIRTWYLTDGEKLEIVKKLKEKLGSQYDVVLEKDHIHIEFQPK